MRTSLTLLLIPIALLGLFNAIAIADPSGGAPAGFDPSVFGSLGVWSSVVIIACVMVTWALRNFSSSNHFFHTPLWQVLSSALAGVAAQVPQAIVAHGLTKASVLPAIFGALVVAFTQSKPTGKDNGGTSAASAMLPFLLASSLLLTACPGAVAFGKCELAKLPSTLSAVVASIASIASQPAGYVQDLKDLGQKVAPDQIDCVAIALAAEAQKAGHPTWRGNMATHLREYLNVRRQEGAKLSCDPTFIRDVKNAGRDMLLASTPPTIANGDLALIMMSATL